MSRTRVFLADDHSMLLEAFIKLIEPQCDVVGVATDGEQLLERAVPARPDVIVLDIGMPKLSGIEAARLLRKALPDTGLVFLTVSGDPNLAAEALAAAEGAGFLLKNSAASELLLAIEEARQGRSYITPRVAAAVLAGARTRPRLTPRQRDVLKLLTEGLPMKQVAYRLGITSRTVAHHKYSMMGVLGIESSAELIRYAVERGIVADR